MNKKPKDDMAHLRYIHINKCESRHQVYYPRKQHYLVKMHKNICYDNHVLQLWLEKCIHKFILHPNNLTATNSAIVIRLQNIIQDLLSGNLN